MKSQQATKTSAMMPFGPDDFPNDSFLSVASTSSRVGTSPSLLRSLSKSLLVECSKIKSDENWNSSAYCVKGLLDYWVEDACKTKTKHVRDFNQTNC